MSSLIVDFGEYIYIYQTVVVGGCGVKSVCPNTQGNIRDIHHLQIGCLCDPRSIYESIFGSVFVHKMIVYVS